VLGWDAVSMRAVRLRAGVSNGSLFHLFPTRQDLELAVVASGLAEHQAVVLAVLDRAEGVRTVVHDHLDWVAQNRQIAVLLLGALPGQLGSALPESTLAGSREFSVRVEAWLRRSGWTGDPDLLVLNSLWLGPANDYARAWLTTGRPDSSPATADVLAEAAWHALRPHLREES
jgi:AcrR family transcriptional regulator